MRRIDDGGRRCGRAVGRDGRQQRCSDGVRVRQQRHRVPGVLGHRRGPGRWNGTDRRHIPGDVGGGCRPDI